MNPSARQDDLLIGFREEALDLLQDLPLRLAEFGREPGDSESINCIFRSVHTIKGNAGFFGLLPIKNLAHALEDAFDEIRQGRLALSEELQRALVAGLDVLNEMVDSVGESDDVCELSDEQSALLKQIEELSGAGRSESPESRLLAEVLAISQEIAAAGLPQADDWASRLRALASSRTDDDEQSEHAGRVGLADDDPTVLAAAEFLAGEVDLTPRVRAVLELFAQVDAGTYQASHGQAFIDACTEFAAWAKQNDQLSLHDALQAGQADFETIFNSPLDVDPFLISVVWDRLVPELAALRKPERQSASETSSDVEPSPDADGEESSSGDQSSRPNSQAPTGAAKPAASASKNRFLRVKEECVDGFLDDVSDLFVTCERLKDLHARMASELEARDLVEELRQINTTLASQSTALQKSVVELRKVPVRGLFSKFPRVARTLASQLGKQLDVHLAGEEIEIDKSLLEDLDGPLMHMIRNVCDHGIEPPEERTARGLSPTGNLWMECGLTKSHVVITVRDDGRGVDPERLRHKAISKELMTPEQAQALDDEEAVNLIFHPGFSTAEQISEVSGRGVGLDVVKTRLREHGGDVKVESKVGAGTTFRMSIPIRKAVVVEDGLLVRHGRSTFVIPYDQIGEIVRLRRDSLTYAHAKPIATVRGEPYAAVSLDELLDLPPSQAAERESFDGVLIKSKQQTICLMVDAIQGQRKVVVSGLNELLGPCDKISGVAQLGSGRLALVLNGAELITAAAR